MPWSEPGIWRSSGAPLLIARDYLQRAVALAPEAIR